MCLLLSSWRRRPCSALGVTFGLVYPKSRYFLLSRFPLGIDLASLCDNGQLLHDDHEDHLHVPQ